MELTEKNWWAIQECLGEIHIECDHKKVMSREKIRTAYMKIDEIVSCLK